LRGILTALENFSDELVIVATVDMPGISRGQLEWIAGEMRGRAGVLGMMMSRETAEGKQVEPFPSVYRREAIPTIQGQLAQGRRSVHGLLNCQGFMSIEAPADWAAGTWANLNTPGDLRNFCENL
jgi:molybdopterin-guanine dinucleotide biosynthesis protein A